MKRTIGIDLGTTNCCVATTDETGRPTIITSTIGETTTPSVVSFDKVDEKSPPKIGSPAQSRAVMDPKGTLFGIKRLCGRRFDDPEVQTLRRTLPYDIVSAPNGDAWLDVHGVTLSPEHIAALLLQELRTNAEKHFGAAVDGAIITVPAHFDNTQRKATKDAATIAGLDVRRLINEPTAAALGYGAHRGPDQRLAVCDLGGGTFDVSIVNVEGGVVEVISAQGDLFLGGEDIDRFVLKHILEEIQRDHDVDLTEDPQALQRLKLDVARAKHNLSSAQSTRLELLYLGSQSAGKALDYKRILHRSELDAWITPVLRRLEAPCREAAGRCGLNPHEVDAMILVGGATRTIAVQQYLASIFRKRPSKVVHPDEIVAIGAATQAAILDGRLDGVVLLDVTSRALGLRADSGDYQQVIPANATIPTREHRILPTTEDDQKELFFEVYEGEAQEAAQNRQLGRFVCTDLPQAPAGEFFVLVEFTVDVDGVLHLGATDLRTGTPQNLYKIATAGLPQSQIETLRKVLQRPAIR